ncbi:MAG: type IV secretory system conjugative DNA transfer family protein, partial [Nocardia sp.]|nr:type IV secretory system conjugative DNA transfer family protein [Nocardia sp.]
MAKKVKDPADPGPDISLYAIFIGFGVVATLWVALHLGNSMAAAPQNIPINPLACAILIAKGKLHWPAASTVIALLVALAGIAFLMWRRETKKRKSRGKLPVDDRAQHMGSGGAIAALTEAGVREKAAQLGVRLGYDDSPGVPIGVGVIDGQMLYGSYEDLHLDIWGPRQGKTTSRVIPAILSAIGPVLVTSNKRDVVDSTRAVREDRGSRTFVFDPQGVAGESHASWYWDPLAWVAVHQEGCEVRAARLAGHFADADDGGAGTADSFFDPEAEDLLAALFLAAALDGRPITAVWDWVTDPSHTESVQILRMNGRNQVASGLAQQYNANGRVRDSIFGTAKKMVRCLKQSNVLPWIMPGGDRYQFDEREFLDRNWTLYCLSLEGRGSAGPLVSALTEAVIDVA